MFLLKRNAFINKLFFFSSTSSPLQLQSKSTHFKYLHRTNPCQSKPKQLYKRLQDQYLGLCKLLNDAEHIFYYLLTFLKLCQLQHKDLQFLSQFVNEKLTENSVSDRKIDDGNVCGRSPHSPRALQSASTCMQR